MTAAKSLQIILYFSLLILFIKPLGTYIARIYEGQPNLMNRLLWPIERRFYCLCKIDQNQEMNWKQYAIAVLIMGLLSSLLFYFFQRIQYYLPLNLENFPNVPADLAFNTATSFVTNTNWQAYAGENTFSYTTQMLQLTVQNFISAATGMAILMALIRGLRRQETTLIGNFWVDCFRGIFYILLPLSLVFSLVLVSQGVIQNFSAYQTVEVLDSKSNKNIPMGPVASQVAIKQLGTNGGGFFGANSAHPFENPNPLTNFLEMLAILLIPAALCYSFGRMIRKKKQGIVLLISMFVMLVPLAFLCILFEGYNLEGKELRFGSMNSAFWASLTTASANGSVNAMLDSFQPLAVLIPLSLICLGEVVFGGVGSGLYMMIIFVILTVFISGLMVGRTPEFLGKKIEAFEIKMASFTILIMPLIVLIFTGVTLLNPLGKSSLLHHGTHGLTEMLYAFSSMTNNNGSALAGIQSNTPLMNTLGGIAMLIGRYWIAIPILAIAGSLAKKRRLQTSLGTLPTDTFFFGAVLIFMILIMSALIFFPSFALGPIAEHFLTSR